MILTLIKTSYGISKELLALYIKLIFQQALCACVGADNAIGFALQKFEMMF